VFEKAERVTAKGFVGVAAAGEIGDENTVRSCERGNERFVFLEARGVAVNQEQRAALVRDAFGANGDVAHSYAPDIEGGLGKSRHRRLVRTRQAHRPEGSILRSRRALR